MTSRKPKLNLLYVDTLQPRLQLAVVTSESNSETEACEAVAGCQDGGAFAAARAGSQALRVESPQSPGGWGRIQRALNRRAARRESLF